MELGKVNGLSIQVETPNVGQIIIIPSGFTGYFLVITEFAEDETLAIDRMTKEEVEEKFNIQIELNG